MVNNNVGRESIASKNASTQNASSTNEPREEAPQHVPILSVESVTFGYAHQPLLYDVHLQVQAGEMLGLLGPNGSGKTTLLRLISVVLRPQQGAILLEGRKLQQLSRRNVAQRIAVVPQELHMPFAFTVEQ